MPWPGQRQCFGAHLPFEPSFSSTRIGRWIWATLAASRLAELLPGSVVYTVDKDDFTIYRKNGRQPVPCIFPD